MCTTVLQDETDVKLAVLAQNRFGNERVGCKALEILLGRLRWQIQSAVTSCARNYPSIDRDELEAQATIGAIKYIDSYDPSQGAAVSTWAHNGIRQGIDRACRAAKKSFKSQSAAFVYEDKVNDENPLYAREEKEEAALLTERIEFLLTRLSDYAQGVISAVLAGESYADIALRLGKSYDSIRMLYKRSMKQIKEWLAAGLGYPPIKKSSAKKISLKWLRDRLWSVRSSFVDGELSCTVSKGDTMVLTQLRSRRKNSATLLSKITAPIRKINAIWNYRLTSRGRLFSYFVFSTLAATLFNVTRVQPSSAQCVGWMCGPFNVWLNSDFWEGITGGTTVLIIIFSAIQMFLLLAFIGIAIWAFVNGVKERSLTWPFIVMICYVAFLLVTNFAGGLTVSQLGDDGFTNEALNGTAGGG